MKKLLFAVAASVPLLVAAPASADPQAFLQKEREKISQLLRQPASTTRDRAVVAELEVMVDYDELARRAFGTPCPTSAQCTNHWGELTDAQRAEVRGLLKRLVEKNYQKNLMKTLDYEVVYKGTREVANADAKIRTESKSKLKPRDPAIQIDYVLKTDGSSYRVVDIITEGSSLTKNYYDQFHRMLITAGQGYPHVVKRLNEKIAKKD